MSESGGDTGGCAIRKWGGAAAVKTPRPKKRNGSVSQSDSQTGRQADRLREVWITQSFQSERSKRFNLFEVETITEDFPLLRLDGRILQQDNDSAHMD